MTLTEGVPQILRRSEVVSLETTMGEQKRSTRSHPLAPPTDLSPLEHQVLDQCIHMAVLKRMLEAHKHATPILQRFVGNVLLAQRSRCSARSRNRKQMR